MFVIESQTKKDAGEGHSNGLGHDVVAVEEQEYEGCEHLHTRLKRAQSPVA